MRVNLGTCLSLVAFVARSSVFVGMRTSPRLKRKLPPFSVGLPHPKDQDGRKPNSDTPSAKKKRRRVVTPISTGKEWAPASTNGTPSIFLDSDFQDLEVSQAELRASTTLTTGQCFHC